MRARGAMATAGRSWWAWLSGGRAAWVLDIDLVMLSGGLVADAFAWASVVDNRSGDPTFIPARSSR